MSDRVRVLLLIKGLGLGGAERLLERAIPYFDRRRFDYCLAYLLPWKNALVPVFEAAGIPVFCLDMRSVVDVGVLGRLTRLLRDEGIDLVHAHLPLPGVLARLAKRRGATRWVVYTEHSLPSRHRLATRCLNLATYGLNDAVIAVSDVVAREAARWLGGRSDRLTTVPNAVDVEAVNLSANRRDAVCREFGFPVGALIVVHVGNLRQAKGHRHLLAAARRVVAREDRARFLLVGTGPLAVPLVEDARRLGLDGRVVFTGFRTDATALIGAADLFVLPSLHEGLPISLLEAMALGRPVVAFRVGGVPEVAVDGETGVLVPPGDVDALAEGILELLADPDRRERMGRAARARVHQGYGMAEMVATVEGVYRKVIGLHG
ncbi:MAG: glycosyltransferase [Armatimonadota bacterium]|nr:glycosyltransferase [Armatimonadota bacterium]MDR7548996.1 glycosyltransferase [Armatimonadota bacterium]